MNAKKSKRTPKTWKEKLLDDKNLPRVEEIPPRMRMTWGEGTIAIPAPREVDAIMRKVPKGKVTTINELRKAIAAKHSATIGCPMTTGIFAWIAANAAEENRKAGKKAITPYWRTLKDGGAINEKYPGGQERQRRLLQAEGHTLVRRGNRYLVADYAKSLVTPRV